MDHSRLFGCLLIVGTLLSAGCQSNGASKSTAPVGSPVAIKTPLGLPPLPIPSDNPPTAETIALGKKLYFSPILSIDKSISCSTCHDPGLGFTDRRSVSIGVRGGRGPRNAPTILNAAYNSSQFWDGRAPSLEEQASGPMMNLVEMAHTPEGIEQACANDPELKAMFAAAFGPAPITMARVTKALAAYERTLLSGNSPFDRYYFGNEPEALDAAARRGFDVFRNPAKGNCTACHTMQAEYALFTDNLFHNLGAGMNAEGEIADPGRYQVTSRDRDKGAFRTPSLRNVALTAPYMHDGSLKTLKDVVDFYVAGGNSNPNIDKLIRPLPQLTRQDRSDLVAFLESLTGAPTK